MISACQWIQPHGRDVQPTGFGILTATAIGCHWPQCLGGMMGDKVEPPTLVGIHAVERAALIVALVIHQRVVDGQEPQRPIHVHERRERRWQTLGRGLVQHLAKMNQ